MNESRPVLDEAQSPGKSIKKEKHGLVPCQQRKLKCDRKVPCTRCIKSGSQCTQSSWNPRQRRRRFPERDLIDRIRRYEDLLRSNAISFEPLHPSSQSNDTERNTRRLESGQSTNERVEGDTLPKSRTFWDVVKQSTPAGDHGEGSVAGDFDEDMVKTAWDGMYSGSDLLLFGPVDTNIDLLGLHPTQVNILKLWQVYLENVDPLLKLTHTPTMQTRIINATGDLSKLKPAFEALMFSIYCVALYTLADDECITILGSTKESLLPSFRLGVHQALRRAAALRADNLDCLVAMFLYFISVEGDTDPRSLSSALAMAFRVAQRMGIDTELNNAGFKPLEAEMRRRLWWAMTAFDNRVGEQSQTKARTLEPSWDCSVPLNIHDLDIQPGMSTLPGEHERPTESIFAVTYAHMHDYIRRSPSHLYFTRPTLKAVADSIYYRFRSVDALEKHLEESVFIYCDPNNSLHLNTILTARRTIGKIKLMEFSSRLLQDSTSPTDSECDAAISSAVVMLESDTQIMSSPLTKPFRWFASMHFPFPAYLHIIKDLRDRPLAQHVVRTWQAMSENHQVHLSRAPAEMFDENPVLKTLMRLILQAWATRARALASAKLGPGTIPDIVLHYRAKVARSKVAPTSQSSATPQDPGLELPPINDSDLFDSPANWDFNAFDFDFGAGMDTFDMDWSIMPE